LLLTRGERKKTIQITKAWPIDPLVLKLVNHNSLITVLEITVDLGYFLTNFNIWPTKIHFDHPILLYIFNGSLQNVLSSKNGWSISDLYFYHCNHWDNALPHNTHNVMYAYNLLGVRIIWCVFAVNRNVNLFHGGHLQYEHCPAVWMLSPPTCPVCYSSYR